MESYSGKSGICWAAGSRMAVCLVAAAVVLCVLPRRACAQDDQCGIAKDFTVQALEQIKTGTPDEIENGVVLLEHANEVCISYGDAWYYLSLFESRLGQTAKAAYALSKARMWGSAAMNEVANPFVLAAPPQPGVNELPPLAKKWALIVGISRFRDPALDLRYTAKDARDLSSLLQDPRYGRFPPSHVTTLTGSVTTRELKENLNQLAREAGSDDMVVIFLASHGTSRSQDTADVNYVVTSDTDLTDQNSLFATAVAMVEISDIVRSRIRARRTVVILDTCHSGGAASALNERALPIRDFSPSASVISRIDAGVGRVILTSSKEGQSSYEGPPYQNGYFTHFLLAALRQNDGGDTMKQIYAYVRDRVSRAAAARAAASRGVSLSGGPALPTEDPAQTPTFASSQLGDNIILGAAPHSTSN